MGFDPRRSVELIATLVRWHLLLATVATTRDPDDPATVMEVLSRVADPEAVSLLVALTEADARATAAAGLDHVACRTGRGTDPAVPVGPRRLARRTTSRSSPSTCRWKCSATPRPTR